MIVCKIEVWPHGIEERKREIGMVVIANDGTGTSEEGNYKAALAHAGMYASKPGAWKGGKVTGHRRMLSPYHLLRSALDACLKGRATKESHELVKLVRDGGNGPLLTQAAMKAAAPAAEGDG